MIVVARLYSGQSLTYFRYVFASHYEEKARKARNVAHACFIAATYAGQLPAWEGRLLYSARVDPHLTYGAEAVLDIDDTLLKSLTSVQHEFARRLLGLQARSATVVLHSELGIEPLPYRRALIALRYMRYLTERPHASLVAAAYRELFDITANLRRPHQEKTVRQTRSK